MGAVVVVKADAKGGKVGLMLPGNPLDEGFRGDAFLAGTQHDRGAVGFVGAAVPAFVAAHLVEAGPDVGLDVFHQMADVDGALA